LEEDFISLDISSVMVCGIASLKSPKLAILWVSCASEHILCGEFPCEYLHREIIITQENHNGFGEV
jgi:hypothetical protein